MDGDRYFETSARNDFYFALKESGKEIKYFNDYSDSEYFSVYKDEFYCPSEFKKDKYNEINSTESKE